jgi:hypothetical protein
MGVKLLIVSFTLVHVKNCLGTNRVIHFIGHQQPETFDDTKRSLELID